MSFITDKQTLEDLNIPGRYRPDSVFSLFNKVVTQGGERLLSELFQKPLSDHEQINERSGIFQFFTHRSIVFPFSREEFNIMEDYLSGQGQGSLAATGLLVYWKKLLSSVVNDDGYNALQQQLLMSLKLLSTFADFLNSLLTVNADNSFLRQIQQIRNLFSSGSLKWLINFQGKEQISAAEIVKYDYLLRSVLVNEIEKILDIIYQLDVYIAVSTVARSKGFSFANALPREKNLFTAASLRHPCLEKAIGNAVDMNRDGNVVFLTGANMAGKSTFMKSFGIAIYLAHMGFPVAADEMSFSVKDGLYTSINVPDNLNLGYSHFYAEVLRVKNVALQISKTLDLVIIFDELFKGTNVKDAYDATLAVTEAFAKKRNCFFIISTHITEAGEELRKRCSNLQFVYFPSLLNGNSPTYTYQLEQGISNDRHGMVIIKKEGILELITG